MSGRLTVTAIVAVRNGERYLREALASIAAQTRAIDELIVVDGNSTDATVEIALASGARVVVQEGRGIAAAYNEGIAAATGEAIAFLSHDDRWRPEKIAVQLARLEEAPAVDAVVCHVHHFLEGSAPPPGFRRQLLEDEPVAFIMETLVVHRRAFEIAGGFDSEYTTGEDVDWFARARDKGVRFAVVPEVLVDKRVHGRNASLTNPNNSADLLRAVRASVLRKRERDGG